MYIHTGQRESIVESTRGTIHDLIFRDFEREFEMIFAITKDERLDEHRGDRDQLSRRHVMDGQPKQVRNVPDRKGISKVISRVIQGLFKGGWYSSNDNSGSLPSGGSSSSSALASLASLAACVT